MGLLRANLGQIGSFQGLKMANFGFMGTNFGGIGFVRGGGGQNFVFVQKNSVAGKVTPVG